MTVGWQPRFGGVTEETQPMAATFPCATDQRVKMDRKAKRAFSGRSLILRRK